MSRVMPSTPRAANEPPSLGRWVSILSAGLVLGFPLALALSGLLVALLPGGFVRYDAKHQLGMWSMGLFWSVVLCLTVWARRGHRAWLWLLAANVFVFALLFAVRNLSGG